MSATFSIPTFSPTLETINIYVDDEVVDSIPGYQKEYSSTTIANDAVITVGSTSNKVAITTFETDLTTRIRLVCQITADELSMDDIVALIPIARREVLLEIAQYKYGEELSLIKDNYYKLPNKYFFDFNCGGVVSPLDIEVFKQTLPLYEFTAKVPVTIIDLNTRDAWIQLDTVILGTEILKINYYYIQRDARYDDIITMVAWKVACIYYTAEYTTYTTGIAGETSQVKIGDITIKNGAESASINFVKDRMAKSDAQFKKVITYFKRGFYRVK